MKTNPTALWKRRLKRLIKDIPEGTTMAVQPNEHGLVSTILLVDAEDTFDELRGCARFISIAEVDIYPDMIVDWSFGPVQSGVDPVTGAR